MMLVRDYPKRGMNTYENWRSNKESVIAIPQCKNEQTFTRMNQKTNWLDDIPSQVVGPHNYAPSLPAKWVIEQ